MKNDTNSNRTKPSHVSNGWNGCKQILCIIWENMIKIMPVSSLRGQIWYIWKLYLLQGFPVSLQSDLQLSFRGYWNGVSWVCTSPGWVLQTCPCRISPGRQGEWSHHFPPDAKAGCHTGMTVKANLVCSFILQMGWEERKSWRCMLLTMPPGFWLIVNQHDTVEFQKVRLVSVLFQ